MSAAALPGKLSREDYKKQKELEELRKTGAAPPELDDDGNMINPHIPEYISKAPWYLNNARPGLKHQKTSSFAPSHSDNSNVGTFTQHYQRGKPAAAAAAPTKFIPGSCTNCGSTTHKVKDCLERPRAKGAALTGANIAAADRVMNLEFTYDGKRDRWNGYDTSEYSKVIRRFETTEMERKKKKLQELDAAFEAEKAEEKRRKEEQERGVTDAKDAADAAAAAGEAKSAEAAGPVAEALRLKQLKKQERLKKAIRKHQKAASANNAGGGAGSDSDSDSDGGSDSDDEMADNGEVVQKTAEGRGGKMTVRNLRIREDTAKYLRNLNPNSAHYDPKTRSMRENPYEGIKDPNDVLYAGDNFVRKAGATKDVQALQSFAWEAAERGNDAVHVQALPSQAERMFAEYTKKKEALKEQRKAAIINKYGVSADAGTAAAVAAAASGGSKAGGGSALPVSRDLLLSVSEAYVEYDETGRVVKGLERAIPRSKYLEDVRENGHSHIWGSFWKSGAVSGGAGGAGGGQWGYACCHQTIRHSICTGEAGKAAGREMAAQMGVRVAFKDKPDAAAAEAEESKKGSAAAASAVTTAAAASTTAAVKPAVKGEVPMSDAGTASEEKKSAPTHTGDKRKRQARSRSRSRSSSSGSSSGSSSDSSSGSDSGSSSSSESDDDDRRSKRKKKSSSSRRSRRSRSRSRSRSDSRDKKSSSRKKSSSSSNKKAKVEPSSDSAGADARVARGYNSYSGSADVIPDEKEMDEYHRSKRSADDPLNNIPSDRLLDA